MPISTAAAETEETFRLSPNVLSMLGMESGYVWLSGNALVPAGGRPGSGTPVSISRDLGVDQGEVASLVFQSSILERHEINFELLMLTPNGVKKVPRTFRFQNKTYERDTMLETKLDLNWIRFEYGYRLFELSGLWVAPRIGIHHIRQGLTIIGETREAGEMSNTRRLDGTFPVLGCEARQLLPLGLDLRLEMEGAYLLTRGYLGLIRLGAIWQAHPDVMGSVGCTSQVVKWVETNQPLNNQWSYTVFGLTGGLSFTF
jgi:hypothetical protein